VRGVPDPSQPVHLRPVTALADRVLLPGDPGRALALAQVVLGDDRKMFNHHRGLWGYTGTAADGALLTVQSTGMGGPSAAVVLEELAALGVRSAVRVGTARALQGGPDAGVLLAVTDVLAADGTSRALGAPQRSALDAHLTAALTPAAARAGLVVSSDVLYDDDAPAAAQRRTSWLAAGALASDLETAALAAVAARRAVRFAALLTIAAGPGGERCDDEALEHAGAAAGRAAAAALAAG
jgi:uridine phosphorylase